jgi:hypothetical protein
MDRGCDDLRDADHHCGGRDRKSDVVLFNDLFPEVSWSEFVEHDKRNREHDDADDGVDQSCSDVLQIDESVKRFDGSLLLFMISAVALWAPFAGLH